MEEVILREAGKEDEADAGDGIETTTVSLRSVVCYYKKWDCSPSGFFFFTGKQLGKSLRPIESEENRALVRLKTPHKGWRYGPGS